MRSTSSFVRSAATRGVSVVMGAMAFAVMPAGPSWTARKRVSCMTPALDAEYAGEVDPNMVRPEIEATLMMRPAFYLLRCGIAARQQRKTLRRLSVTVRSHSSTEMSSSVASRP